ncbi:MAG: hypothetical protein IJ174_01825, partial [Clostridia bacterium]|nr:hypothetical protein [Clostridia bacterium]
MIHLTAYCLHCETQKCNKVADHLQNAGILRAFSPKILSRQRKQGKNIEHLYDLLPGYVFAYTEEPLKSLDLFFQTDGVIRCLGDSDKLQGLAYEDLAFALALYNMNGLIGSVSLLKEGDSIRIQDPLFDSYSGTIISIDHRKVRAKIQFKFDH